MRTAESVKWRHATYRRGLEAAVPEVAGVYSIAQVSRRHGLVIAVEHLYIGKSLNLRRRWREHVHRGETNPGLNGLDARTELEFWWRRASADEIAGLENELIGELRPRLNRRLPVAR